MNTFQFPDQIFWDCRKFYTKIIHKKRPHFLNANIKKKKKKKIINAIHFCHVISKLTEECKKVCKLSLIINTYHD
jgi:hypothetical protein